MEDINLKIAEIVNEKMYSLSEEIVARQYKIQPEIWEPYGEKGQKLALRDSNYHFKYLIEALIENDSTIFSNYLVWLKQLFEGLNFPPEALTKVLECTMDVLRDRLSPEMSAVTDKLIETAQKSIEHEALYLTTCLSEDLPLHHLAKNYLECLLTGDRRQASKMIMDAVTEGASLREIYIYVFQQTQYEIGRLWHLNKVSVAQEHYCSAATQLIMSQLYPYIFSNEKKGRRFVAACVGGELHELGIRMVADFFEMDGWDTYYMGANTPTSSVLEAVETHKPDILGISTSIPTHIGMLKELIEAVRKYDKNRQLKILVGGYALRSSPDLWVKLGADGFAEDALQAVVLANQLAEQITT